MINEIITKHALDFEAGEYNPLAIFGLTGLPTDFKAFRVGSIHGLWSSDKDHYKILALINDVPGNGHLEDVFQWFEHSCKRDKKYLLIQEVWNQKFKEHLLKKRGFKKHGKSDVIKKTFKP